jgi:hypothetical protein
MTTPNNNHSASKRELQDSELASVSGGLVVPSIIAIQIPLLIPPDPKPVTEKHWFNGG